MTTTRTPVSRPALTLADDLPSRRVSAWLAQRSSSAFLVAAGLLGTTGALLITEDRLGVTLFPAAITALAMGAIALSTALGGLAVHRRSHQLRGGLVAMAVCGIVAASGVALALSVAVGIATGGLTGDAPAVVDRAAALTMLSLALGLFLALLLTGIGAWKSAIPSRGVGLALVLAAVPFLVPTLSAVTGFGMSELVGLGLFVTWTAIFGGVGLTLRRG